jgi:hypothetical protein
MAQQSAEERSLSARIAASERWAKTPNRADATSAARSGLRARFEREADPDGTLTPEELEYRVGLLQKAHMLRMSLAAKKARRQAKEAREAAVDLDREAAELETALDGDA